MRIMKTKNGHSDESGRNMVDIDAHGHTLTYDFTHDRVSLLCTIIGAHESVVTNIR